MYLTVKNLTIKYKDKTAVENIDFELEKGKLLCLLGPSGCGKSTILKAIGGFIKPDSGSICLDGEDITRKMPEERDVSTVFQSYGLFAHMNVISNVTYGLKFKNISKSKMLDEGSRMLDIVGLGGYENKRIPELSGGEQQRVALARSLIVKPKLLLLDEPLSNLDAKLRDEMRKEIVRVQKELHTTTIFVTHDQEEAFEIADEIILMNRGRIDRRGTGEEIYNYPQSDFALNFIGDANVSGDEYVRPEMVEVGTGDTMAIIEGIIFKGHEIELSLNCDGKILKALVLNRNTNYQIGQSLPVSYKMRSVNSKVK